MPISAPWPHGWPRPRHLRAVARRRPDGATDYYWYCRLTGTRLPDPCADPGAFFKALGAAREPQPQHAADTVGEALIAWRRSPEVRARAPRTRQNRDRYTKPLDALADRPLTSIKRRELLEIRDALAEGRGNAAANMLVQSVSAFLSWCVDRGRLEWNPLARVKALEGGHFLAWTEAEAQHAMAAFREPERRAVVLAYHLGQRRGDLIRLGWSSISGGKIRLVQEKTRAPVLLPLHPDLARELDTWRRDATATTILTGPSGTPWTRENLSQCIKRQIAAHRMREGLNLHGLRKLAGARLAEAGATASEIMAVLGHATLAQATLYTRSAERDKLAEAAVIRLANPRQKADR